METHGEPWMIFFSLNLLPTIANRVTLPTLTYKLLPKRGRKTKRGLQDDWSNIRKVPGGLENPDSGTSHRSTIQTQYNRCGLRWMHIFESGWVYGLFLFIPSLYRRPRQSFGFIDKMKSLFFCIFVLLTDSGDWFLFSILVGNQKRIILDYK